MTSNEYQTNLSNVCKLGGKLDRCMELTHDVLKIEETHRSHTKGLFRPQCLIREIRIIIGCCCELSRTTNKVNVNLGTTNKRGEERRDLYIFMYELAVVHGKCVPINVLCWNLICLK